MKVGKDEADDRVESALYASATGYEHDDVDIRVVGAKIVKTTVRKYYPPVPTSMVFWLKNRRPDVWKDRLEHTGAGGGPIKTEVKSLADDALMLRIKALQEKLGGGAEDRMLRFKAMQEKLSAGEK